MESVQKPPAQPSPLPGEGKVSSSVPSPPGYAEAKLQLRPGEWKGEGQGADQGAGLKLSGLIALIRYVLATALRDRLFHGLLAMLALAAGLSLFVGGSAIVEQQQMIAAYTGAMSRAILAGGVILFVAFHVHRALENGEIALILSRPISRPAFILAYGAGLMAVASLCAAAAALLVAAAARPPGSGYLLWAFSLLLEANLIAVVAMFFVLILGSAVSGALGCFGFYVLGRMSGLLGALALRGKTGTLVDQLLGHGFEAISLIIPRLDFFARSEWLVYGAGDADIPAFAAMQSLVFIPLVLAAAMFDFSRKRL